MAIRLRFTAPAGHGHTNIDCGTVHGGRSNVCLPFGAWGLLSKLTRTRLGRRIGGLALKDIQRAASEGTGGHIVDVTDDKRGERVEIFFE